MSKIHKLFELIPDSAVGNYLSDILGLPSGVNITDYTEIASVLDARRFAYGYQFQASYEGGEKIVSRGSAHVKYEALQLNPTPTVIKNTDAATISKALAYALLDLLLDARASVDSGQLTQSDYDEMISLKPQ